MPSVFWLARCGHRRDLGAERMLGWSADEVVGRRTPEAFLRRGELAERAEVARADAALNEAKRTGRDRLVAAG